MLKFSSWRFQDSKLLRPFQVRDRKNRTLLTRCRKLLFFVAAVVVLAGLAQNRTLSLLANLNLVEQVENEFTTSFYTTYNDLYYWLDYQGNLAEKLATSLAEDATGKAYWDQILAPALSDNQQLASVSFGAVGAPQSWHYQATTDGWIPGDTRENQNFSAWFINQSFLEDRIYWRESIGERSQALRLFWLWSDATGQRYYFLAQVNLDFSSVATSLKALALNAAVIFHSPTNQRQIFMLNSLANGNGGGPSPTPADDASPAGQVEMYLMGEIGQRWLATLFSEDFSWQQTINQPLTYRQLDSQGYWVKRSNILTHTDFNQIELVVQERELLGRFGIRSWMLTGLAIGCLLINVGLFFYYYYQYSRRYFFTNQIKEIVKQGEGMHLEFKSTLRFDLKEKKLNKYLEATVLKSIAAFNNSDGGILLLGVDDKGKILGLKADYKTLKKSDKDGFELHLRSLISREFGEHFALRQVEIFFPVLGKEEVCVVRVKKGAKPLYTIITDKSGGKVEKFYIRLGNSSQSIVKPSDIVVYQKERFSWRGRWWSGK